MDTNFKVIFWDFDGVLMNSNPIRDLGFEKVLADYPEDQVELLLEFHKKNGGLSRYVKFRHFFETIRGEILTEEKLKHYTDSFSKIMLGLLIDSSLLINETIDFVKKNHQNYIMHIVSGSDQNELRKICKELDIDKYFLSIHGSPTPKNDLVKNILTLHKYKQSECILIGDSINDLEAANINSIQFSGFGNSTIKELSTCSFEL